MTPPPAAPVKPTVLTLNDIAILKEQELTNLLTKIQNGGTLTAKEWDIVNARAAPPSPAVAATPAALPAAAAPLPPREAIAARYRYDGTPLSLRTVDRCNAIGELPTVHCPPPWDDAPALAAWYREHYRSDLAKEPTRRDKLPAWLSQAVNSPRPQGPILPAAEPLPAPVPPTASASAPLSPADVLNVARLVVADKHARWLANRNDAAAETAYLDAAERLQQMESRARKAGDSDDIPRARVIEVLSKILPRVPHRIKADLTALFPEASRVFKSQDPHTEWAAFAGAFTKATLSRLTDSNFAELLSAPATV